MIDRKAAMSAPYHNRFPSRTPEDKVVVIGAGIAGSMAARSLAKIGQQVEIVEGKEIGNNYKTNQRSEMTLPEVLEDLGVTSAATTPLDKVVFHSFDTGRRFEHRVSEADNGNVVAVAIDHGTVISGLHKQLANSKNIEVRDRTQIVKIDDLCEGVAITYNNGEEKYVKSVVNAAGPGWKSLEFPTERKQKAYKDSIVAFAYGKRCKGKILVENGETTMYFPISADGSGKTSWVNACGNGEIELIYSDYSKRSEVGKIDRIRGYEQLKKLVLEKGIVEIEEEGPTINGFFALEPAKGHSGYTHVFPFGERAQYNAASVGDAIAPGSRLAPILAGIIANNGTTKEFEEVAQANYNNKFEMAVTRFRMQSQTTGQTQDVLQAIKWMDANQQRKFLQDHHLPIQYYPLIIAKNPHLLKTFAQIGIEYIKEYLR